MGSLAFAVSIHSIVTTGGSYAGFAAILGLAILVLLHFAQARESAGLREQAYDAAERVEELEARLAELSHQQAAGAAPAAVPAQAGVPAPASAAAAAMPTRARPAAVPGAAVAPVPAGVATGSFPWAPAGVAAPALTAATTLIPVGGARAGVATGERVATNGPAAPPGGATQVRSPQPAPVPVGVGGGSNGGSHARVAAATGSAPPSAPAGGRAGGPGRPIGAGGEPRRPAGRPGAAAPRFIPPDPEPARGPRTGRVIAILAGILMVVAAIAVALVATSALGGKSTANTGPRRSGTSTGTGTAHTASAFSPRVVTVAVLNGTATAGLAGRTSKRLAAAGYKPGTVATASDQTNNTTVVGYLPGYRTDAMHVATALKLPPSSVQQVNPAAQAVACPPPGACAANVIVTVGADLASAA